MFSKPIKSLNIKNPESKVAPKKPCRPAAVPPAAPPPTSLEIFLLNFFSMILTKLIRLSFNISISSSEAPFCGLYTFTAPFLPKIGFVTSHATFQVIFLKS